MSEAELSFDVTDQPGEQDVACVVAGLVGFNVGEVGPSNRSTLAVFVRDEDEVLGGLIGYTAWGWLYVEKLWLHETVRGRGAAARLLGEAEAEAQRRGCHGAWIDTFNPQALKLYQKQGYTVFGELPQFPKGRSRYFLRKEIGLR